jgi:hypothetical protein
VKQKQTKNTQFMKKVFLVVAFLFASQIYYSQETNMTKDTIGLKEVLLPKGSNKKIIRQYVKQIRKNLRENYNIGAVNYLTDHFFIKDNRDTLANQKTINKLDIKALSLLEIQAMLLNDANNFHTDASPCIRFEPSVSNNKHWIAFCVYYNSLEVIDYDFFENISNYNYTIAKQDNVTTVTFIGSKYYSGYFSFNSTNYNLIRVMFKNTKPFDRYAWGTEGNPSRLEFNSHWKYNDVLVKLDFAETDNGRLLLKKLDAKEELTQFEFKRYLQDPKRVIDSDRNIKFYTTLSMRILE